MTKTEAEVVRRAVRKLRGERASAEVQEALRGPCRVWLETWVIPALELLLPEGRGDRSRDPKLALELLK